MNEISHNLNKLTNIYFFKKENFDRDLFHFYALIIGYFIIETINPYSVWASMDEFRELPRCKKCIEKLPISIIVELL